MLSIFGPQSSGKSTLLNELFETNLETLSDTAVRQRTTSGIQMSHSICDGLNILSLDCEGTDSKERHLLR